MSSVNVLISITPATPEEAWQSSMEPRDSCLLEVTHPYFIVRASMDTNIAQFQGNTYSQPDSFTTQPTASVKVQRFQESATAKQPTWHVRYENLHDNPYAKLYLNGKDYVLEQWLYEGVKDSPEPLTKKDSNGFHTMYVTVQNVRPEQYA